MKSDKQGILNREKIAQQSAAVTDEGLGLICSKCITIWQRVFY